MATVPPSPTVLRRGQGSGVWSMGPPDLETSGSWRMRSRNCSMLMRMAQQGKQQSRRMRVARCRITPTRSRFLLP